MTSCSIHPFDLRPILIDFGNVGSYVGDAAFSIAYCDDLDFPVIRKSSGNRIIFMVYSLFI